MNRKSRPEHPRPEGTRAAREDGAGARPSAAAVAVLVAAAVAGFLALRGGDGSDEPRRRVPSRVGANPGRGETQQRREMPKEIVRRRIVVVRREIPAEPGELPEQEPDMQEAPAGGDGPDVSADDYIAALHAAGDRTGVGAFPLPGTRPPRSGVVVPPDYVLPEGFARHFQATDRGDRLEPILIVAPGYEILDEDGAVVPLTDDRIVPPEYAPLDLPLQLLDVPSDRPQSQD